MHDSELQTLSKIVRIRDFIFPLGLILIALNRLGPFVNVSGYALIIISIGLTIMQPKISTGKWYMWVLIGVIVILSVIRNTGMESVAFAVLAPLVYLIALNTERKELSNAFGAASLVASLSIILMYLIHRTGGGGIVDSTNYNLATGVVILGALLAPKQYRWILLIVAIPALDMAGSEEAIFGLGVLALACVIRRDFGYKMISAAIVVVICGVMMVSFHQPTSMYDRINTQVSSPSVNTLTDGRQNAYQSALTQIQVQGHGYNPVVMEYGSIHDVPLMILYQIGPIGLVSFLGILGLTYWKTKDKYLIIGFMSLCIWDHFMFTELTLWSWMVLGLLQVSDVKDYIWREKYVAVKETEQLAVT